MPRLRRSPTLERIRAQLGERPCTALELMSGGVPKASVYYDLKRLMETREVERKTIGRERRYRLVGYGIVPSPGIYRMIAEKLDEEKPIMEQAMADLEELAKHSPITESVLIERIVKKFLKSNASPPSLIRILRSQSQLVADEDAVRSLKKCAPRAEKLATDARNSADVREDALVFVQTIARERLPDIVYKIISDDEYKLDNPPSSQFAILIEQICIEYAKHEKWRRILYGLLTSKSKKTAERAARILERSRRPPFLTSNQ